MSGVVSMYLLIKRNHETSLVVGISAKNGWISGLVVYKLYLLWEHLISLARECAVRWNSDFVWFLLYWSGFYMHFLLLRWLMRQLAVCQGHWFDLYVPVNESYHVHSFSIARIGWLKPDDYSQEAVSHYNPIFSLNIHGKNSTALKLSDT